MDRDKAGSRTVVARRWPMRLSRRCLRGCRGGAATKERSPLADRPVSSRSRTPMPEILPAEVSFVRPTHRRDGTQRYQTR